MGFGAFWTRSGRFPADRQQSTCMDAKREWSAGSILEHQMLVEFREVVSQKGNHFSLHPRRRAGIDRDHVLKEFSRMVEDSVSQAP